MFSTAALTNRSRIVALMALSLLTAACGETEKVEENPPVRGLRVYEVSAQAQNMERRFPSLVQPADETPLSFEISGQLTDVKLEVGAHIAAGETLLTIDETTLRLEVQQARAALQQAEATLQNARTDFARKEELLKSGNVTKAAYDTSETNLKSAQSQVDQARQQYAIAEERLDKAVLKAPFDGVISKVDAKSFANVAAGQTALSLYSENAFEVEFTVPATIINELKLGDPARVEISDMPGRFIAGRIKEIGSRAAQVSAFPVVVALEEDLPGLKAGMSADVAVTVGLIEGDEGFLVPIHCFVLEDSERLQEGQAMRDGSGTAEVYVFDPASSTVSKREVLTAGVRENLIVVISGLESGELLASAGVSYLHDGQKVRRLPNAR